MTVHNHIRWVACCATALALACLGTMPASALTNGGGAYAGSGTASPGLSLTPTAQTTSGAGTLVGAAAVNGSAVAIADSCNYTGSTNLQSTLAESAGSLNASCTGSTSVTGLLTYTRIGAVVVLQGTVTVGGANALGDGACAFVPTSAPTVTSYELACALVASDTI
jgi:hypothetical protein